MTENDALSEAVRLETEGWQRLEVRAGKDLRQTLQRLGDALGFPDYYRPNLDAFWECLSENPGRVVVVMDDWLDFVNHDPEGWAAFEEVVAQLPEPKRLVVMLGSRGKPRRRRWLLGC